MIRTLIVDDSPLVRDGIRLLLSAEKDIEIVGEAGDGCEAVAVIERLIPDLTFLDVQMPGLDGFQVIERCATVPMGAVIFVTAYDDYALRAFESNALGYVLKPSHPECWRRRCGVRDRSSPPSPCRSRRAGARSHAWS